MQQETALAAEVSIREADDLELVEAPCEADVLIRDIRRCAKRRRRLQSWLIPLIAVGMITTVLVLSHVDMRLSLAIFGVSAAIVAVGLITEAGQWGRMSERVAELPPGLR